MNVRNIFLGILVIGCIIALAWAFCGPSNAADLGGPPVNTVAVHVCPADCAHYQIANADLSATRTRLERFARSQGYEVVEVSEVPVRTGPTFSGALKLGGATSNPGTFSFGSSGVETCPMAQLNVRIANLLGPITLTGEVRHAFCSADKAGLYGKSKYVAGLEVPAGPNTNLFASYERAYRSNSDWAWAGVNIKFGG